MLLVFRPQDPRVEAAKRVPDLAAVRPPCVYCSAQDGRVPGFSLGPQVFDDGFAFLAKRADRLRDHLDPRGAVVQLQVESQAFRKSGRQDDGAPVVSDRRHGARVRRHAST